MVVRVHKVGKFCSQCGAKTVEYKHSLSQGLIVCLYRLYLFGEPTNLKHLRLTHYQWSNFQKLRYWGLVAIVDKDGKGVWKITAKGEAFIEDGEGIKKSVWTYRTKVMRFDGPTVFFRDYHDIEYKTRQEYAEEALPHPL